jgi:hypothetical protein
MQSDDASQTMTNNTATTNAPTVKQRLLMQSSATDDGCGGAGNVLSDT